MSKVLVEICCGSIDDAIQAAAGGADRVELNSAFFLGGLTPSLGTLLEVRKRIDIPIIAMVRPRAGGMYYSDAEFVTMLRDAEMFLANGATGIAFGFLTKEGKIDQERTKMMMDVIGTHEAVFHRAFDVTPDPYEALEQLITLGVKRVLTSGQQANVVDGWQCICQLIDQAKGRIEILPGAGLNEYNIELFIERTNCQQVHLAPMGWINDPSAAGNTRITYGGALYPSEVNLEAVDRGLMKKMTDRIS